MLNAKAWSDDHNIEIEFDADDWFTGASSTKIFALAVSNWTGEPTDNIVQYHNFNNKEVEKLFDYLKAIENDPVKEDCNGFGCSMDKEEVLEWLGFHRPEIFNAIDMAGDGATYEQICDIFKDSENLIHNAIKELEKSGPKNRITEYLLNHLKANIDDMKEDIITDLETYMEG